MLFNYRWRCVSLRGSDSRDSRGRHGHRYGNLNHLRRRGIECPHHPEDRQVSEDNSDQGTHRDCKNLLKVHLSCPAIEQSPMQTNPMLVAEEDARIDGLYRVIQGKINWDNLVPTLLEAGKELEAMPGLKGSEKLDLLQKTLKHALKVSDKTDVEKEQILHYIDTVVPIAMQAATMASKNPLVNAVADQVQAVCIGCWTKH